MIKSFISIFFIISATFGFDSIEVLNPNITIHKSGYFTTDKDLTPNQAFETSQTNLQNFPKNAYSLGLTTDTAWFVFEASTKGDEKLYLDSKDIFVGTSYDLFVFQNGLLIKSFHNGHSVPIEQRDIQSVQIRFALEKAGQNITYLLRAKSELPYMPVFSFGTLSEIDATWTNLYNIMLISYCIGISFLIYNLVLYLITKDKSFFHYCIYIFGLLFICLFGRSYIPFGITIDPHILKVLLILGLAIAGIGLAFFTISFLGLQNKLPKSAKILNIGTIMFGAISLAYFLIDMIIVKLVFLASFYFLTIYTFYVGFRIYKNGYIVGLHFLYSTGIGIIFMSLFMLTFYTTNIIPINVWSITLVNQGIIWDVITLSLAIAYRIKLLQEENLKNQRLSLIKSKQTSIGELSGNIAHQWRHPLAELSAILMNMHVKLEFAKISKDELISQIKLSSNIIQHLSSTVDTFQSFFQNKKTDEHFNVNNEIKRCINFMKDSLANNDIKLEYTSNTTAYLNGNSNEFSQIIMNIVLNAKDVLIERGITNGHISIELKKYLNGFKIEIQDNGGGIDIKPIDSIFDSYITTKQNGTGIGLFIAKTITEQKFNGTITAHNQKDGAIFEITFTQKNI